MAWKKFFYRIDKTYSVWGFKNVVKGGLLLEQSVISRKYIKFILQVILAVCIQCVITFFWHQERTFLFYTLSLYVSLSFSDDLSQLIFRNDKWCICFKQHGKWQIRVFSNARFRIIANHSLDNALVVYVNDSSRKGITMVILQKFSSAVLRSLRVLSAILGVVIGNIALNALSSQHPIWIWLPLALLSIFLLVLPQLLKRELDRRPLEERQFTPKQIYAGMGLAHSAIILAGIYRLLTVRDAEWRLIIIVVIVLDICLLVFLTPRVLKIIKQSERG